MRNRREEDVLVLLLQSSFEKFLLLSYVHEDNRSKAMVQDCHILHQEGVGAVSIDELLCFLTASSVIKTAIKTFKTKQIIF